jgi:anthranilate synthase/aminodeoxychorismate synthase-like glutamine amidotransferase
MILVIDNYDSFVHNLARYVEICRYKPLVIRNDAITIQEIEKLNPEKIIISPGPCTPDEAGISLEVVRNFYTNIPILGVCLGHQVIGQAFNARVTRATIPLHGMASSIRHNQNDIFRNIPNPLTVGRYHSLIVDHVSNDSELFVTAKSFEGEIMALQHKLYPVFGVQFHPESILTDNGLDLIQNFISIKKFIM